MKLLLKVSSKIKKEVIQMEINFADPELDRMDPEKRQKFLDLLVKEQVRYAYETTEFYKNQFDSIGLKPEEVGSVKDLREKAPILTKDLIISTGIYNILPMEYQKVLKNGQQKLSLDSRIYRVFSTGGTTGKSIYTFYTKRDWDVAADTALRWIQQTLSDPSECSIVLSTFNSSHIIGTLPTELFYRLGSVMFFRELMADGKFILQQIKDYKCNTILALPQAMGKAGGSDIESLLTVDTENVIGEHIKTVISLGFPMKREIRESLKDLGISNTYEWYGSSEVVPIGMECKAHNGLHLMYMSPLIEIIDTKSGEHVTDGERGRIIVTALQRQGSQFIRYDLGDEATFIDEPCECGRTTPRIKDIKRVEDLVRLETGCRVWE